MPMSIRAGCLIVLGTACLLAAGTADAQPSPATAARRPSASATDTLLPSAITKVLLLGTGTPIISTERSGNSVAVIVRGVAYVVDAGPGVIRRVLEARSRGIRFDTLAVLFLTHLHSDHTLGVPEFMYYHGDGPLNIIGPAGTEQFIGHLREAWAPDVYVRTHANPDVQARTFEVHAMDVRTPGVVYRDSNVVVTAYEVPHTIWPHALSYRFDTPDRHIVVSGDQRPNDTIVAACDGCDILLHEVYSVAGFSRIQSENRRRYHAFSHTSSYALGEEAARAHPKLLVLYHQLFFGVTPEALVSEVRTRFDGRVVSANDLDVF